MKIKKSILFLFFMCLLTERKLSSALEHLKNTKAIPSRSNSIPLKTLIYGCYNWTCLVTYTHSDSQSPFLNGSFQYRNDNNWSIVRK